MVGAGRFERPTPCAQGIGCPHLGINRFNNLRTLLVGPCGNFSYNLDCKAAIRLVKPPTIPTGSPAGSADCEINQCGRAHVVTAGSLKTPSIAGFKLGDPPAFAAGGPRVKSRCGTGRNCCPARHVVPPGDVLQGVSHRCAAIDACGGVVRHGARDDSWARNGGVRDHFVDGTVDDAEIGRWIREYFRHRSRPIWCGSCGSRASQP